MRNTFFKELKNRMYKDESLFLLVADMGLGLVEDIQNEFPDRFLNVGIAEQNMIGVASGLCNVGFRPFCYTISNFLIQRAFEQIRNDVCLHNYPVTLIGTSTGFDNGLLGPTHQVIDDIGCLKILPNIRIYSPSSINAIRIVFEDLIKNNFPSYVRIGKGSDIFEHEDENLNHFILKKEKSEILVISHGTMIGKCIEAARRYDNFSIFCMNKIKPLYISELKNVIQDYSKIIVIEDHIVSSGLYDSICTLMIDLRVQNKYLYKIGPPERYEEIIGDTNYFSNKYGCFSDKICDFIMDLCN